MKKTLRKILVSALIVLPAVDVCTSIGMVALEPHTHAIRHMLAWELSRAQEQGIVIPSTLVPHI